MWMSVTKPEISGKHSENHKKQLLSETIIVQIVAKTAGVQ